MWWKKHQKLCTRTGLCSIEKKEDTQWSKANQLRIGKTVPRMNVKSPKTYKLAEGLPERIWSIFDEKASKTVHREEECVTAKKEVRHQLK